MLGSTYLIFKGGVLGRGRIDTEEDLSVGGKRGDKPKSYHKLPRIDRCMKTHQSGDGVRLKVCNQKGTEHRGQQNF